MKQLYDQFSSERDFDKVLYTDIKKDYNDKYEKISFINQVIASINNDESILYLIDEATYLQFPDKEIMKIQDAFTSGHNHATRVVLAGSQSKALEYWGHLAFAGDAVCAS